jgi:hypothetical protein
MLNTKLLGTAKFQPGQIVIVHGQKARQFIAKLQAIFDESTDVKEFRYSNIEMSCVQEAASKGRFLIRHATKAMPRLWWATNLRADADDLADVIRWTGEGDLFGLQLRLSDGRAVIEASE